MILGDAHIDADRSRPTAWEWVTSNKHPDLLPTPWLTDTELEDFTEALLVAERLLGENVRHVRHVERWGVLGDAQQGIDFYGRFSDGTPAAWQVKQLEKLTPADVREVVDKAGAFKHADEFYLVIGKIATQRVRAQILDFPSWTILDRRTLTEMFHLLPIHSQRDIAQRFWGTEVARHFAPSPGDAMLSFERFRSPRHDPALVLNDLGPLSGREVDVERIARLLDANSEDRPRVILLSGPGGRGKTRLLIEALAVASDRDPSLAITCLRAGRIFDSAAMQEIQDAPGVIVIDDAHEDPKALHPLLAFAASRPDVQLVLASRPSGVPLLESGALRAGLSPASYVEVPVGELTIGAARRLVAGLTDGMQINFALRNYLANEARHSPHVTVILTNLIRKGEISGAISVNENLRRSVLSRYEELLLPSRVAGHETETVHRILAIYSCLQPEAGMEGETESKIAALSGVSALQLARITRELIDRGIVINHGERLRVVPDVLADHILENVVSIGSRDSGFVAELWHAFSDTYRDRLVLGLSELDWRMRQRGGPRVMATIWQSIREQLASPYPSRIRRQLEKIAPLASTHPAETIAALEELRTRLEAVASPAPLEDPEDEEAALQRRLWPNSRPVDWSSVQAMMPDLYARAALNDSAGLETALNAILLLAEPFSNGRGGHIPALGPRVLTQNLSALASLPNDYPARMVKCIDAFLRACDDDQAYGAIAALNPLLGKEELETVQSDLRELSFTRHRVSPAVLRPARDLIRGVLAREGLSAKPGRAAAAVEVLGEALRPPHGYFGNSVDVDEVLGWENDDLATITALTEVARGTEYATIRRSVRQAVTWSAQHAESLEVQRAALALQVELDEIENIRDRIVDRSIRRPWGVPHIYSRVPSVEELRVERAAKRKHRQSQQHRTDDTRAAMEKARARAHEADLRIAQELVDLGDARQVVGLLEELAQELRQMGKSPNFKSVWNATIDARPTWVPELASAIAAGETEQALDASLPDILYRWAASDPSSLLEWFSWILEHGRRGARLAVAAVVGEVPWNPRDRFAQIWNRGIADSDHAVANRFLGAGGWYLRADPVGASATLLGNDIAADEAARALEGAWQLGPQWIASLDVPALNAVLALVRRAGLESYITQEILGDSARSHPGLALDTLLELASDGASLPDPISSVSDAFSANQAAFADWLMTRLGASEALDEVVRVALNDRLEDELASALASRLDGLRGPDLTALVEALTAFQLWVPHHLPLAEACMQRAEDENVTEEVSYYLRDAMRLRVWGWSGQESPELVAARDACLAAASRSTLPSLEEQLREAAAWFEQTIERIRRDEDEDL